MHLADPIFIFILALVLLGPKRTGELAQQLGKLMAEFRKASNDFKYQFNEEMRVSEQQEQQKKQGVERAELAAPAVTAAGNSILPPAAAGTGSEAGVPYAVSATTGEEHPVEDHPLLRVDVIPPMEGSPADQTSTTAVTPATGVGWTANSAPNGSHAPGVAVTGDELQENEAPVHRG